MAAGKIYKGKNVRLKFDDDTLYHATSCKISVTTDLIEVATKDTNGKVSTPDSYSWSVSAEALVADKPAMSSQSDAMDIVGLQLAGTEIEIEFTTDETGDFILSGKCYCTQSDIDASSGAHVTGSFSFTGNGDLTKSTVPAPGS